MAFILFLLISTLIFLASSSERPAGQRLIKLNLYEPAKWMSNEELNKLLQDQRPFGFIDLTRDGVDIASPTGRAANPYTYPTQALQQKVVRDLFSHLKKDRIEAFVQKLSSFHSRHAREYSGPAQAEGWLNQEIESVRADYKGVSSIRKVATEPIEPDFPIKWYNQENIILRLEGHDSALKDELIILGAHYDSVNGRDNLGEDNPDAAPGADDNATGCAVLLELLRLIVQFGIKLKHGLELHWYTAEEMGLLGSKDVVKEYVKNNAKIKAMLNLDVLGYQSPKLGKTIAWFNDSTDEKLMTFVKMLAEEYLEYKVVRGTCNMGCTSDHAAWTEKGFPAAFVAEAEFTPHLHSAGDTIGTVNFEQVNEFAKLAVAFVIELSELDEMPVMPAEPSVSPEMRSELGRGCIVTWIGFMWIFKF